MKRYPERFGIMGRIAIDHPERAQKLPTWRNQPGVLGVRVNYGFEWLTNGMADWFWAAAEKANVPVMFLTNGQNGEMAKVAAKHPGLTLICDHMGISTAFMRDGSVANEIGVVASLAKYQNVSVKLSSIPPCVPCSRRTPRSPCRRACSTRGDIRPVISSTSSGATAPAAAITGSVLSISKPEPVHSRCMAHLFR